MKGVNRGEPIQAQGPKQAARKPDVKKGGGGHTVLKKGERKKGGKERTGKLTGGSLLTSGGACVGSEQRPLIRARRGAGLIRGEKVVKQHGRRERRRKHA